MGNHLVKAGEGLDPSFGEGGKVRFRYELVDFDFRDFARLDDGSLLVLALDDKTYTSFCVWKLNEAGELDTSFGEAGFVHLDMERNVRLTSLHRVGEKFIIVGASSSDLILFRLHLNGSWDAEFGNAGELRIQVADLPPDPSLQGSLGRGPMQVRLTESITTADHGRADLYASNTVRSVVEAGNCFIGFNAYWPDDPPELVQRGIPVIVCLDEGGGLAASFNDGRPKFINLVDAGGDIGSVLSAVAVQDGALLLLGARTSGFSVTSSYVLRVLADGTRDYTFGSGQGDEQGLAPISVTQLEFPEGLTVDPDGAFKAWGFMVNGNAVVLGFTENGAVDARFGEGGWVTTRLWSWHGFASSGTGENYRVTGFEANLAQGVVSVLRLLPNGKLDPDFGEGGVVAVSNDTGSVNSSRILLIPDNKILLGFDSFAMQLSKTPG